LVIRGCLLGGEDVVPSDFYGKEEADRVAGTRFVHDYERARVVAW
jgi:hypothetical protein